MSDPQGWPPPPWEVDWVPVKGDVMSVLPPYGQAVLTCDKEGNLVVCRRESTDSQGEHWHLVGDEAADPEWFDVTHWALLPRGPARAAEG